jgi:hypothetical protein
MSVSLSKGRSLHREGVDKAEAAGWERLAAAMTSALKARPEEA